MGKNITKERDTDPGVLCRDYKAFIVYLILSVMKAGGRKNTYKFEVLSTLRCDILNKGLFVLAQINSIKDQDQSSIPYEIIMFLKEFIDILDLKETPKGDIFELIAYFSFLIKSSGVNDLQELNKILLDRTRVYPDKRRIFHIEEAANNGETIESVISYCKSFIDGPINVSDGGENNAIVIPNNFPQRIISNKIALQM